MIATGVPTRRSIAALSMATLLSAGSLSASAQTPRGESHARDRLTEYNVALGVECTHCHVEETWHDDSKPPKQTAAKMASMTAQLNAKLRGVGEVRCWTCHAGRAVPERLPQGAIDTENARWPSSIGSAPEATRLRMAMYSASTGLRCGQCHDGTNWKRVDSDRMRMVPRMVSLFAVMQPFVATQVECYTCHKGANKPRKDAPKG